MNKKYISIGPFELENFLLEDHGNMDVDTVILDLSRIDELHVGTMRQIVELHELLLEHGKSMMIRWNDDNEYSFLQFLKHRELLGQHR